MRFYQLHRTIEHGESAGYEYFTNKSEAEKARRAWLAENPEEALGTEVQPIEIEATRAGILRALNRYASHNDNG